MTALLSATATATAAEAEAPAAEASPTGPPDRPEVPLAYNPGLDGLRAVALLAMLAYHHGVGAVPGGFLAVSMFFTLSGFLIATLTLGEWARGGRVSLARFWERRARRLLPVALATLIGVVLLQALLEVGSGPRFRGDVAAAVGYVANWRFATSGSDYGASFATDSPVQHFWSLAVEEQFYLTFPLLFVGLTTLLRGRWRRVGAAFGLLALASFAAAWISADRYGNTGSTYYATWTRAGEVLVGVALAYAVVLPGVRRFLGGRLGARLVGIGGIAGLVGLLWLWTTVGLGNTALFRGATALDAAFTCLVILACRQRPSVVGPPSRSVHSDGRWKRRSKYTERSGVVAAGLGLWPLRGLGKVSYGAYLIHWPLYLVLDERRLHIEGEALLVVRVGATIALAVVSYHALEAPFRFGWRGPARRLVGALAVPAVALAALALVLPVHRGQLIEMPATVAVSAGGGADAAGGGATASAYLTDVAGDGGPHPVAEVLLVGDSVSWTMWPGLLTWNQDHPDQAIHVDGVMALGCPLGGPAPTRFLGEETRVWPQCAGFRDSITEALHTRRYDAVVVQMGHMDLGEREVAGAWRHLGDPAFDDWMRDQVAIVADLVAAGDVPVLWASLTHVDMRPGGRPGGVGDGRDVPENDPARVDRLNEIVAAEIADRPGFATLDVGGWLSREPGGETGSHHRMDGVHWTFDGSDEVGAWVVPQILNAVADDREGRDRHTGGPEMGVTGGYP
jgi:peptidoglycan/LPS O-acetylase OafA/YrhL